MSLTAELVFIAVMPVIILLTYIYSKDKKKEPMILLLELFALGIFSSFLVYEVTRLFEVIFPFMNNQKTLLNNFLYVFIGIALVEESCKWIMVFTRGYFSKEFDEKYDIVVYAVFVSLGFAFFENMLYVLSNNSLYIALLRGISAVPSHACDAVFMGYYLSLAKQSHYKRDNKEIKYIILSIIVPAILHGMYDYCLLSGFGILAIGFLLFVIVLFGFTFKKISNLSKANKNIFIKNNYCSNCGTKVSDEYCSNCGMKQQ